MARRTLRVTADTSQLSPIRDFVGECAREAGLSDEAIADVSMAVDESATNIIRHAYREDPDIPEEDRWLEVEADREGDDFILRLRDRGKSFNPVNVPPPDMERHLEESRTHGLGLYVVQTFMDGVEHHYSGGNEVVLRKKINPASGKTPG